MKNLTILLLVMISLTASAQISKGNYYIGGGIGLYRNDSKSGDSQIFQALTQSISISPSFGKFVNDKWLIGGSIGLGTNKNETSNNGLLQYSSSSKSYYVAVSAKYLIKVVDNFYFTLENRLSYWRSRTKGINNSAPDSFTTKYKSYSIGLGLSPTFIFFPSTKWALEGGVGSVYVNRGESLSVDSRTFNYGLNLGSINFGIGYYFTR